MGNEGSVPTSEDEFESQARAPPSSIDPISSQQQPPPHPPPPQQSSGRSGRMINAVFHRRSQQPSTVQNLHPYPGAPAMTEEDMVLMSPEQQQMYYQEQQELYEQQHHQQQQPLQQYYSQSGYPPGGEHAKANAAIPASTSTTTASTPTKKGLNFRPTGRAGAAILNSMKNLSLGSSRNVNKATAQDWEQRWDEDDDSDEGEDQSDTFTNQPAHTTTQAAAAHHVPPFSRPGMDPLPPISSPVPQTESKPHLVTATPEPGMTEDGVEWDTGIFAPGHEYEKPNVQMFLPMLRVLGKGSFGKVGLATLMWLLLLFLA